jgi:putative Holliday junction resolvase
MRILAIDYGAKRIGLAVSDPTLTLATPLGTLAAQPYWQFVEELKKLVLAYQVHRLLIGLPRNMDGTFGPSAQKALDFGQGLRTVLGIEVVWRDERLTTKEATRILEALLPGKQKRALRAGKTDALSAALLLQTYLDEQRDSLWGENQMADRS